VARTITVASQKGGVGKTTTAVNLAASLALAGRRVLLVDLDPQGNATSGVSFRSSQSLTLSELRPLTALSDGKSLSAYISQTSIPNLFLIPSGPEVADLDLVRAILTHPPERSRAIFAASISEFDYVLLDCPPSLQGAPTFALFISDAAIIPVQCEYYAMEGLSQILPLIHDIKKKKNPALEIEGLLLTMFAPELELSRDVLEEVTSYFRGRAFRTVVPRDVTLAEAASHGQPAIVYEALSRGAWSYIEVAREVLHHG
jgi:chromosome partitioning protein